MSKLTFTQCNSEQASRVHVLEYSFDPRDTQLQSLGKELIPCQALVWGYKLRLLDSHFCMQPTTSVEVKLLGEKESHVGCVGGCVCVSLIHIGSNEPFKNFYP